MTTTVISSRRALVLYSADIRREGGGRIEPGGNEELEQVGMIRRAVPARLTSVGLRQEAGREGWRITASLSIRSELLQLGR
jgi:hypothetical protein